MNYSVLLLAKGLTFPAIPNLYRGDAILRSLVSSKLH